MSIDCAFSFWPRNSSLKQDILGVGYHNSSPLLRGLVSVRNGSDCRQRSDMLKSDMQTGDIQTRLKQ